MFLVNKKDPALQPVDLAARQLKRRAKSVQADCKVMHGREDYEIVG